MKLSLKLFSICPYTEVCI